MVVTVALARGQEAIDNGCTEMHIVGGLHHKQKYEWYLNLIRILHNAYPELHLKAWTPVEIDWFCRLENKSVQAVLEDMVEAGLGSLPGTAADILDAEVRPILCPDKLSTAEWFEVVEAAHRVGLRSTATIMFGHVERPVHWARHLHRLRALQDETGGFTEFVPLPFVGQEAPMHLRGLSRAGPTAREAVLMHAVARLVLHPLIPNVQVSWVKLGPHAVRAISRTAQIAITIARHTAPAHSRSRLSTNFPFSLASAATRYPVQLARTV